MALPRCPLCGTSMLFLHMNRKWWCRLCGYLESDEFALLEMQSDVGMATEADCHCGHSHYDHVGWRAHLEGESRRRTNCRIVRCGCGGYHEGAWLCQCSSSRLREEA